MGGTGNPKFSDGKDPKQWDQSSHWSETVGSVQPLVRNNGTSPATGPKQWDWSNHQPRTMGHTNEVRSYIYKYQFRRKYIYKELFKLKHLD